jgi:hypothetical protein
MPKEYEVTWGMIYEAENELDALKQALGDLAEVTSNPSVGPNIFVIRQTVEDAETVAMPADSYLTGYYWCAVCHEEITGTDIENRHSTEEGEDCHEKCCVSCGIAEAEWLNNPNI